MALGNTSRYRALLETTRLTIRSCRFSEKHCAGIFTVDGLPLDIAPN